MDKYLIMSDLDGTLLNKKSKLSKKSIKYIKKIVNEGHYFVLATGRPYQGCINFYKQLGIDSPLVCDNGGSIHFPNNHTKDIFITIPLDLFKDFIKEIKDCLIAGMSSHFDIIYYYNKNEVPTFIQHLNPPRKIIEGNLEVIVEKPPINPTLFIKNEYFDKVINILNKEKYSSIIKYRFWRDYNDRYSLELYNKSATKGHALLLLKDLLKIKKENDLVFGDQMNDIEMIQYATNGVAMCNGRELVKKIAKYITYKPNHRDGEIHFIKKYFKKIK